MVSLNAEKTPNGIMGIITKIKYNTNKLTFVKHVAGTFSNYILNQSEPGIVRHVNSKNITDFTSGVIGYYYFETNDIDSITNDDFEIFVDLSSWNTKYIFQISEDTSIAINRFKVKTTNLSIYSFSPGDIDNDGDIDTLDLVSMKKILLGVSEEKKAADCNGDGVIDVLDFIRLSKVLAGTGKAVRSPMTGIPDHL